MNAIDDIPEPHRTKTVSVLEARDPGLLRTLRAQTLPTYATWRAAARS
jgi:hypothetical protein